MMRPLLLFVALFIAAGVFVAHYADQALKPEMRQNSATLNTATRSSSVTMIPAPSAQYAPAQNESAPNKLPEIIRLSPSSRAVTLRQDSNGHYQTQARVDGTNVDFVVDTGATAVMLSATTAARLGIRPARSEYTAKVMTANGEIKAAIVKLNKIELGDITVRDVRALVHADDKLSINLLGMTFLSHVRWTHDRGRLIIEELSNN